jgi:hypothetical protein
MTASPIVTDVPGEGWWIDGVYLGDLGTMVLADGWDDVAQSRGENQQLLGIDGAAFRPKLRDVGSKTIQMGVHGANWDGYQWIIPGSTTAQRALYEANLDRLLRLIGTTHRELLVERIYPDGSKRRAKCEATGQITPARQADSYGEIQFQLNVLGGVWEDVDEITSTLAYKVAGPNAQTLEVFSLIGQTAACADAEVTIHGPCSSVSIVDAETGLGCTYPASLSSSDVLVIQPDGRFAITKNGTSVITAVSFSGNRLLRISPAPNDSTGPSVIVTAPGKGAQFSVTVRSRAKWLR